MMAMKQALTGLWRNREKADRSYLLINDVRGYFADVPEAVFIDGTTIPVHVCANEFALRSCSEEERNSGREEHSEDYRLQKTTAAGPCSRPSGKIQYLCPYRNRM